MLSVVELVAQLRTTLGSNAKEAEVLDVIDRNLSSLRAIYPERRREFSEETIHFLRSVTQIRDALRDFIETTEEITCIRTRDDAQELASRISEIGDRLRPHLVAKRAEKETRELVAKAVSLPFAAILGREIDLHRELVKLEGNMKPCRKCGIRMVLRESQHGFFWGCSTFPECFENKVCLQVSLSGCYKAIKASDLQRGVSDGGRVHIIRRR